MKNSYRKVNCYSEGESAFMQRSQEMRGRWLRPLLQGLADLGVNADHITLLSLLAGLLFCPFFLGGWETLAFLALLLHALLDGIDGPLARFRGQASSRGSFADSMADQLVVVATTITMIHVGFIDALAGGIYLFCYTLVVGFAMARNALAAPYSWLFRPRFLIYGWIVLECTVFPGTLPYALWIASIPLAWKTLTGFWAIRGRM